MDGQFKKITIPSKANHEGIYSITITMPWVCPQCGGPRGETFKTVSYDGSLRMQCDGWRNPCGHIDTYEAVREEIILLTRMDALPKFD